jgi:hypothetical protein
MSFNKSFFTQFKEEVEEEHKAFKTVSESKELPSTKCDHKGKVKAVLGGLRCQCGAGWQGARLNVLLDHFNSVI